MNMLLDLKARVSVRKINYLNYIEEKTDHNKTLYFRMFFCKKLLQNTRQSGLIIFIFILINNFKIIFF